MKIVEILSRYELSREEYVFVETTIRESSNLLDGFTWIAEKTEEFRNTPICINPITLPRFGGMPYAFIDGFCGDTWLYKLVLDV